MSISIRLIQQRYLMIPLALLIAMHNNFKLDFNENSRTIRLIYLILHDHKRFLSNSIRILIKEKYITFYSEEDQKQSTSSNSISNGPIPDIQSQPLFRSEIVENRVSYPIKMIRTMALKHKNVLLQIVLIQI
jgi:hypothetical protein